MSCENIMFLIELGKAAKLEVNWTQSDLWYYAFNCLLMS